MSFLAAVVFGLPVMYFFAPWRFWFYTGLTIMTVICGIVVALRQYADTARFGARMTLDEIINEEDPVRMAQLLRYHLGWSPEKIASELNHRKIRNHGLPWRLHDVEAAVKGIVGPLL